MPIHVLEGEGDWVNAQEGVKADYQDIINYSVFCLIKMTNK